MSSEVISVVQKEVKCVRANGEPVCFNMAILLPDYKKHLYEFVCRHITIGGERISVEQFMKLEVSIGEAIIKVFMDTVKENGVV